MQIMQKKSNKILKQAFEQFTNATSADREAFQQLAQSNACLEEQLSQMHQQNMNLVQEIHNKQTNVTLPSVSIPFQPHKQPHMLPQSCQPPQPPAQ